LKKRTKVILTFLGLAICGVGLYLYIDLHNDYGRGGIGKFELSTGDYFTVKLQTNPSTGYSNYWINENKCRTVELISKEYDADWPQLDGSGGTAIWTFRAIAKGTDTIKISKCGPPYHCKPFLRDSMDLYSATDSIRRYKPFSEVDYTFFVEVN
jgi:predicted secreted protein